MSDHPIYDNCLRCQKPVSDEEYASCGIAICTVCRPSYFDTPVLGETRELWYVRGSSLVKGLFVYTTLAETVYRFNPSKTPSWYLCGWTEDDWDYTLGKDVWLTPEIPAKIAKENINKLIAEKKEEVVKLQTKLKDLEQYLPVESPVEPVSRRHDPDAGHYYK